MGRIYWHKTNPLPGKKALCCVNLIIIKFIHLFVTCIWMDWYCNVVCTLYNTKDDFDIFYVLVTVFQEHEKRCWSVDFNHKDPKLLASGSDDSKGEWII